MHSKWRLGSAEINNLDLVQQFYEKQREASVVGAELVAGEVGVSVEKMNEPAFGKLFY